MKKEELTELGLTDEQIAKVFEINGKDVAKIQKQVTTLTDEKSNLQAQLDTANDTLKKFENVDVEQIQKELKEHKDRADKAEKDYAAKILSRDQDDWLKAKFDEYGVASPYARKQLSNEIKDEKEGLKWKDKEFSGFDDFMKKAKEADKSLYLTKEEKDEQEEDEDDGGNPYFTIGGDSKGGNDGNETSKSKIPTVF